MGQVSLIQEAQWPQCRTLTLSKHQHTFFKPASARPYLRVLLELPMGTMAQYSVRKLSVVLASCSLSFFLTCLFTFAMQHTVGVSSMLKFSSVLWYRQNALNVLSTCPKMITLWHKLCSSSSSHYAGWLLHAFKQARCRLEPNTYPRKHLFPLLISRDINII